MRIREFLGKFLAGAALLSSLISAHANTANFVDPSTPGNANWRSSEVVSEAAAESDRKIIGGPGEVEKVEKVAAFRAAPSPLVSKDKVLGSAYFNTLRVLSRENSCSAFFGGSGAAIDVFQRMIARVRKDYQAATIGMSMSGATVTVRDELTKKNYRLFDRVTINTNGPFYRKRISPSDQSLPRLGTFEPNTNEVRVLMFLHELGHVIKGEDGNYLLPDDGTNEALSHENSQKIIKVCGEQIKSLPASEGKQVQ
jgi:hypothetical protein